LLQTFLSPPRRCALQVDTNEAGAWIATVQPCIPTRGFQRNLLDQVVRQVEAKSCTLLSWESNGIGTVTRMPCDEVGQKELSHWRALYITKHIKGKDQNFAKADFASLA